MSDAEDAGKYRVENQQQVQGQVIGDHTTLHQHFHYPVSSTTQHLSASPLSDVVILTTRSKEFLAVAAYLKGTQEVVHPETGTIYLQGSFSGTQGTWQVTVAHIGLGGLNAASETERAYNLFHPRLMLFVGIANGLKDVRQGDVVVATKVYGYEAGKAASLFKARSEIWHASYFLEQRAKAEANNDEWLTYLGGYHPDPTPRVLLGSLATGERVLADQRSSVYQFLQTSYDDVLAVETEDYGFLQVVHANQHISALTICGISVVVNKTLTTSTLSMEEKAVLHATAFAFQMLAKLTLPSNTAGILEQKPLPKEFFAEQKTLPKQAALTVPESLPYVSKYSILKNAQGGEGLIRGNIDQRKNKSFHKRRLFISIISLFVLALPLVSFLSFSACHSSFCHSLPQLTKQSSLQREGEVQDQNLFVELREVISPSFVLLGDPKRYSGSNMPPMSISAVSLAKNTSTFDTILLDVKNLRQGGADILVDYIALKILAIPALPRPLKVWRFGASTTYIGYPYPILYTGQVSGQLLYARPPHNLILTPAGPNHSGESEPLSIQITSTVAAYLRFQIQISYQVMGSAAPPNPPLTLPRTFEVVFSDTSNWQEVVF